MHARTKAPGRRRKAAGPRPPVTVVVGGILIAVVLGLFWFGMGRAPKTVMPTGAAGKAPTSATSPAATEPPPATAPLPPSPPVERLKLKVLAAHPHDASAYTQGLVLDGARLYESTGLYGSSSLRRVDLESGKVSARVEVPGAYFGEGLARVGERLVQLTWREGKAFVYRAADLAKTGELGYVGEGWGLCYDGALLVMSDGSAQLTFRDPETLESKGQVRVLLDGAPVERLNELECVDGAVYANVYGSDDILRIDPASGRVTAVVDASGLLTEKERQTAEVLNGIAYDPAKKIFLITGKLWPKLFEVELVRR